MFRAPGHDRPCLGGTDARQRCQGLRIGPIQVHEFRPGRRPGEPEVRRKTPDSRRTYSGYAIQTVDRPERPVRVPVGHDSFSKGWAHPGESRKFFRSSKIGIKPLSGGQRAICGNRCKPLRVWRNARHPLRDDCGPGPHATPRPPGHDPLAQEGQPEEEEDGSTLWGTHAGECTQLWTLGYPFYPERGLWMRGGAGWYYWEPGPRESEHRPPAHGCVHRHRGSARGYRLRCRSTDHLPGL